MNADVIFDGVENSLRHSGDSVAIQLCDRVFVCDIDALPDKGVPAKGEFEFVGNEVLESDIEFCDGEPYMAGCQKTKRVRVKDCHIIAEEVE